MRWRKSEPFTAAHVVRNHGWWTTVVGAIVGHGYWNLKVLGREHFPTSGPVIVASNHIGVADGPLLHVAIPREPHIMVKLGMMKSKLGGLLRMAGQFPVDRTSGRAALEVALQLLKEGRVVALFPEGTRGSGSGAGIKAGVAWLAQHSGAPVVPAACLGTRPTGASVGHIPPFRERVYVVFGEPIVFSDLPPGRAGTAAAMERLEAALSAHVADAVAQTGVPLPGDEGSREGRDIGGAAD